MPQETRIITTEFLRKIEVALNIPAGHTEISPEIRLAGILQAINSLSHQAGHVNLVYRHLLDEMQDYMEIIDKADFSVEFPDDTEAYEEAWKNLRETYASRPKIRK